MAGDVEPEVPAVTHNSAPDDDQHVPIFGSWAGIYTAVIVCAVLAMVLIGLFSTWKF